MDKDFPKRKPTRWKNFNYSAAGAYFVTICIKYRKKILSEIIKPVGVGAHDDPSIRLTAIGEIVEKNLLSSNKISGVEIDRYIIMPDHIHAIILLDPSSYVNRSIGSSRAPTPTNDMLPHVVSTFKRFCSREIGENIFQRGYVEHIIRNRNDYEEHIKYIIENPKRWCNKELENEWEDA